MQRHYYFIPRPSEPERPAESGFISLIFEGFLFLFPSLFPSLCFAVAFTTRLGLGPIRSISQVACGLVPGVWFGAVGAQGGQPSGPSPAAPLRRQYQPGLPHTHTLLSTPTLL